jgi:HAD superfamily hydrolase (TIGR01662 family)
MQIEPMLALHGKVILDNTYITKEQRRPVIEIAKKLGAKIKAVWLKTSIENAQFNAVWRIEHGGREVPAVALFAAKKEFTSDNHPHVSEGFDEVEAVPFARTFPAEYVNKALVLDYDGTVRVTKSGAKYPLTPDDIEIIPGVAEKIKQYRDAGYKLLGASNQSGVGSGILTKEKVEQLFAHTNKLLGLDIEVLYCPDASFPIKSYDRKPLPGIGVKHIVKHKLDPSKTIMVGDMKSDETFAFRSGFNYMHIDKFLQSNP